MIPPPPRPTIQPLARFNLLISPSVEIQFLLVSKLLVYKRWTLESFTLPKKLVDKALKKFSVVNWKASRTPFGATFFNDEWLTTLVWDFSVRVSIYMTPGSDCLRFQIKPPLTPGWASLIHEWACPTQRCATVTPELNSGTLGFKGEPVSFLGEYLWL
jgi:hypothetical protein